MTTYEFHADPGHAWLAVPLAEIARLGIKDISSYSYKHDQTAYLEEDCDAALFAQAKKAAGEEFTCTEKFTNFDSPIRNFARFTGA